MPGVKRVFDDQAILAAIKQYQGKLTHISKVFKCSPYGLREYIKKNPELLEALNEERQSINEEFLDCAEDRILTTIKESLDEGAALKAAIFTLNSRGQERGWNDTHSPVIKNTIDLSHPDAKKLVEDLIRKATNSDNAE